MKKNTLLKNHTQKHSGYTLVSLLVGVALSAFVVLVIAQLASVAKTNFVQTQNIAGLYNNGREAIEFLRQNVNMAGYGISQPDPLDYTPITFQGYTPANNVPVTYLGAASALPDWVYVGYFLENASPRQFATAVAASGATPTSCAATMSASYSTIQFFGLQSCGQCWAPNSATFDKSTLATNPNDTSATCCKASGACDNTSCSSPTLNCGGNLQNATYQKMRKHYCIGKTCPGANAAATPSGDVLTVYFANTGSADITTFTGNTLAPVTTEPPPLTSYTFQVDSATSTFQAIDSTRGTTAYNLVSNVEYMAVLLGESDLLTTTTVGPSAKTVNVPQMSRWVQSATANLYSYRVKAIRVAIVVRSEDQILGAVPGSTVMNLMLGNDGAWITYTAPSDQYMRKVFTTTVYLGGYMLPKYQRHCVSDGTGNYRQKIGGVPFLQNAWFTNDQCCTTTGCKLYGTLNACETQRMVGGCW